MTTINTHQRRIVFSLWILYAMFYLGRVNFSVAIPGIAESLEVSRAEVGFLGTIWLWVYALGQIVSGQLGNQLSPRRLIALGITIVLTANALMGFQNSLIVMGILWGIGGAGFSLGWGPILRILSETLTTEQRKRTASLFPMNIPAGAAFTWAVVGLVVSLGGWRWGFWGPSIALVGVLAWWWFSNIDAPTQSPTQTRQFRWSDFRAEIIELAPAFVLSAFVGSVALGALTWMPTYVKDTQLFSEQLEGAAAGVLPLVGIVGLLLSGYLMARLGKVLLALMILLFMMALALFLALIPVVALQLGLMVVMTAISFGAMGLVLSTVPVTLASEGRASSAAGISTSVFSIAGGLASALAGVIVDAYSWEHVFVMWGVLMLVGGLVAWANLSRERPQVVASEARAGAAKPPTVA